MASTAVRTRGIGGGESQVARCAVSDMTSKSHTYETAISFASHSCDWTRTESKLLKSEFHKFRGKSGTSFLQSCIRVAAMLPNKRVSDVAQRILWLRKTASQRVFTGCTTPNNISRCSQLCSELQSLGVDASPVEINANVQKLLTTNNQLLARLEGDSNVRFKDKQNALHTIYSNLLAIDSTFQVRHSALANLPRIPVRVNTDLARRTLFVQN